MGRVTFIPLNRSRQRNRTYPQEEGVLPMIEKLVFDPKVRPAMDQIFGQTLICRKLEMASDYAQRFSMDVITLGGDSVNRKGAIDGGYHEQRHSRIKAMASMNAAERDVHATHARIKDLIEASNMKTMIL